MPKVRKTARAEEDLVGIWVHSYREWGEEQAERYFDELEEGIGLLGRNPQLGRTCEHIREGYRALQVNRHVVYYTVEGRTVRIVRVLHERMDPDRHV